MSMKDVEPQDTLEARLLFDATCIEFKQEPSAEHFTIMTQAALWLQQRAVEQAAAEEIERQDRRFRENRRGF